MLRIFLMYGYKLTNVFIYIVLVFLLHKTTLVLIPCSQASSNFNYLIIDHVNAL